MLGLIVRFGRDDRAATAIEYGLIATLVAVGAIVAFTTFGSSLSGLFNFVRDKSTNAMNSAT